MASGTIELLFTDSNYESQASWSSTANSSANTSSLTVTIKVRNKTSTALTDRFSGAFGLVDSSTGEALRANYIFNIDGITLAPYSWVTITSFTTTISHNSAGVAPTILLTGSYNSISSNITFVVPGRGDTIKLDTIIRKATVTSAPNFVDTDNPTIKYSNPMGSNVTSLQVCIADNTGNTIHVPYRDVSKTGSSYTFQLTTTERQALINAVTSGTSITVRFYIKMEIHGSSHRSYVAKTFSISDIMPDLAPAVVDMNETTKALTGDMNVLVKYYSKAACSSNATTKAGATIKSQKLVNGSVTKTNTNGVFSVDNVENGKFVFTVVDSRDNSASATVTKTLINYVKLTCNQSVEMTLAGETAATATFTIKGNYFNGSFGAVNNQLSLQVRYGESGGTMGAWQTLVSEFIKFNGNTYSLTASIENLSYDKSYVFQCRAVDKLATVTTGQYTARLLPIFDWGENDFNFNVPVSFQGEQMVDFIVEQGTASMGTNGTWYWSKWKSGKAECYGVRNYGNMAVSTAWGGLYRSESFNQSLPSGLFNAVPAVINIEYRGSNYGGWIAKHEATAPSATNSGGFIVVRPASATLSQAYIGFHVIGRWK